jgi:hypothetical protein
MVGEEEEGVAMVADHPLKSFKMSLNLKKVSLSTEEENFALVVTMRVNPL